MEKMLVTQALDERDLLRKKIQKNISNLQVIAVKRKKDPNLLNGNDPEKFQNDAKANFQSVNDMIKRLERICNAIIISNATTKITIDEKEMTVAEAISMRKSILTGEDPTAMLFSLLKKQHEQAVSLYTKYDTEASRARDNYMNNMSSREAELSEDQVKSIDMMVDPIRPEYIDPLDLNECLDGMQDNINTKLSKINTAIKISNASTYVEF